MNKHTFLRSKYKIVLLAAGATSLACNPGGTRCAKTQSISVNNSKLNNVTAPNYLSIGGFLDFSSRAEVTDGTDNLKQSRCTVQLDFDPDNSKEGSFFGWIAEHCVNPSKDEKATLKIFYNGGYTAFDIVFKPLEKAKTTRAALDPSFSNPVKKRIMEAFNRVQTLADGVNQSAVAYCQSQTKNSDTSNAQHICNTFLDLARFEMKAPTELSGIQKETIEFSRASYIANRERAFRAMSVADLGKALPGYSGTIRDTLKLWTPLIQNISDARGDFKVAQFVDEVAACAADSTSEICLEKSKIIPLFQANFDQLAELKAANTSGTLNPTLTEEVTRRLKKAENEVFDYWSRTITLLSTMKAIPIRMHTNVSFLDEGIKADATETVATNLETSFISVPFEFIAKSGVAPILTARGMVLANPLDSSRMIFQPGDSGSLVSFDGVYPLGLLSTVNQEPFSGGAVVRPLPVSKAQSKTSNTSTSVSGGDKGTPVVTTDSGNKETASANQNCFVNGL